jgi:hypothetical protein
MTLQPSDEDTRNVATVTLRTPIDEEYPVSRAA